MSESILTSIKALLGIAEDDTVYDVDITMHINSVFSTLTQLGIGPDTGFSIADSSAVWSDFTMGDLILNNVKSYMYLRVRLMFDPPTTGFLTTSIEKQILEAEWRINVAREGTKWTPPISTTS